MKGLHTWKMLTPRDRFLLKGMAICVLGGLLFQTLWEPSRQRLVSAERHYHRQQLLAQQVQHAQPQHAAQAAIKPSASKINDSAEAVGLRVDQIEVDSERLRLTLSGEATALLSWLAELERDAGALQMLTLDKRGNQLEARLEL